MSDDLELQRNVLDELEFEPTLNAAHIGVTANKGVVTLSGTVSSYAEKTAAERAAWRVKGVRAIAEEIEIRLPSDKKRADEEIAARALDILKWQVGLPADRIGIKVEKGVVTLSGEVPWQFQKTEAEEVVKKLSGITGVVNAMRISSPVEPVAVKESIEKALERNAEIEAARIRVESEGGTVTLGGTVRSWYERDLAERAAWAAAGVREVKNRIAIAP